MINFKFCHSSYNNKSDINNDGEVTDEENEYEEVGKPNILNKEVEKEKKTKKKSTKSKETKKEKEKREEK